MLYTFTWDGILLEAGSPASMVITAFKTAAAQASPSGVKATAIVIESRSQRRRPDKPKRLAMSSFRVVIHVLSWPPRYLRHCTSGQGFITSRMIKAAARRAACSNQRSRRRRSTGGRVRRWRLCTDHDPDDGNLECDADIRCRITLGDIDPLRAVARSHNRKGRSS